MRPTTEADQLGALAAVSVDPSIYNADTIFRAAYWFTDRYFVYLSRTTENLIRVELRPKEGSGEDMARACSEFCNALVDFRVRQLVAEETVGVREALVTKAFAETAAPSKGT